MKVCLKLVCLSLLSLFFVASASADELLSVKAGTQLLKPEGSIGGTINGTGHAVDIEDDLELDDSVEFSGEIAINWRNARLSLNLLPINLSGNGRLSETVIIDDKEFTAGEDVATDLTLDLYDVGYTYYLVNVDDLPTRVQLGLEFAVKVADAKFSMTSSSGVDESVEAVVPLPTVGVRGRIALADFLGVTGRVGYIEYRDNSFMDAEVQIEFSPLPLVGVYAGVRYFNLEIDESDVYLDAKLSGPYAGVLVRF
jgi:outer membrane protein